MASILVASGGAEALREAVSPTAILVEDLTDLWPLLDDEPDLVVVGPDVELAVALELALEERITRPSLGVVLVRRTIDTEVLTQALRAGVREVVPADDLVALAEACERSRDLTRLVLGAGGGPPEPGDRGLLVTVFSAKGGCGKTTLATNLAAACAAGGARRVCLVDLDLAFGDVAIALQLFPVRTIADAVGLESELDETAVRSMITPHSPGLDTIVAPVEPGAAEGIPGPLVGELLTVLKSMYDLVVVDTPPAFTDHVLAAFDRTDLFVLLATLDIPAVKNLKLTLETLDLLGYPQERWRVILNRADSKVGLSTANVEKTLKMPIAAQVPSSRAVSASINRGVPIVVDEPSHPVSEAIRAFAESQIVSRPAVPAALRKERRGFSLLRRGGTAP